MSTDIDDPTAIALWGQVIRGFQAFNETVHGKIKDEFGLNESEAETLLNLYRHPKHRAPMAVLSKATSYSTGGFTKLADKLCAKNLTSRAACTDDRRVTYLELTQAGVVVSKKLAKMVAETNKEHFISVLGIERAQELAAAMTELYQANSATPKD